MRRLLRLNALIVVGFVVLHLAGARAHVGFLSGTLGDEGGSLVGVV